MFHLPYLMYLALLKIKTKTNFLIIILYILFQKMKKVLKKKKVEMKDGSKTIKQKKL